jgi:hypothetical protein
VYHASRNPKWDFLGQTRNSSAPFVTPSMAAANLIRQNEDSSNERVGFDSMPRKSKPSNSPHAKQLPSLPKGGGAMSGMGEKFAANPVTGTGSLSIPIHTSPGRSGFGPQLSLSYDSGSGNGPFGFGWSLTLPAITRKTDKGLPQYEDAHRSRSVMASSGRYAGASRISGGSCLYHGRSGRRTSSLLRHVQSPTYRFQCSDRHHAFLHKDRRFTERGRGRSRGRRFPLSPFGGSRVRSRTSCRSTYRRRVLRTGRARITAGQTGWEQVNEKA